MWGHVTKERLLGVETEYGFAAFNHDGRPVEMPWGVAQLMKLAAEKLPHLPAHHSDGIFLANGARFYADVGAHPEMTTPECTDPSDVLRYIRAGERLLAGLVNDLPSARPDIAEAMIFRSNVDYGSENGQEPCCWGTHENIMHRTPPAEIHRHLLPFLVSRVIFTGAGGLDPFRNQIVFSLSPRVAHLRLVISCDSTDFRGILHSKDEPLCRGRYHRLHLLCGESLCSDVATYLKIGATALVVVMTEAGLQPGTAVRLASPLRAMRRFAADPSCRIAVKSSDGRSLTALMIQRHYLELAETHLNDACMPPWAAKVCSQWRDILDRLESGPDAVATMLDWSIKLSLFRNWTTQQGLDWEEVSRADGDGKGSGLHAQLCEVDTRFGQLGGRKAGIFDMLDQEGVLSHRLSGADHIEDAMMQPPTSGRARLRGECVRRFAGDGSRYACEWDGVWDHSEKKLLDLSDPFPKRERWTALPPEPVSNRSAIGSRPLRELRHWLGLERLRSHADVQPPLSPEEQGGWLAEVQRLYEQGAYELVAARLRSLEDELTSFDAQEYAEYHRFLAWVQTRRGFLDGVEALNKLGRCHSTEFQSITDHVCILRFQGLLPPPDIEFWIGKGNELLEREPGQERVAASAFQGNQAYVLLRQGQAGVALVALTRLCQSRTCQTDAPRVSARLCADLGETHRLLGHHNEAVYWLREARRLQKHFHFDGDLADLTFTYRAKLDPDPSHSLRWLRQAKAIQLSLRHIMGEARTLLLEARMCRDAQHAAALRPRLLEIARDRPALAQCRLFQKVTSHWDEWVSNAGDPERIEDAFWCV